MVGTAAMYDKADRLYVLRSILAPISSLRWRWFIRGFHRKIGAPPPPARILAKPVRAYVHKQFWPRHRVALLLEHFHWSRTLFTSDFLKRICANQPIELVALQGRRDKYLIFISGSLAVISQREGEISIYLAKTLASPRLARISFLFCKVSGRLSLVIGGIQGPPAANKHAVIDATRDLHGLRPKDAIFLAVRMFAQQFLIENVYAIGDANHVLQRLQNSAKFSSYDAYWRDRGGISEPVYGFRFEPLSQECKVKNKRNEMKEAISTSISVFTNSIRIR